MIVMGKNREHKYLTLLSLYLAQSVPMSFFSTVLPVIMRSEHFSLSSIGYIQLIKLPWILKFLWAPLVDKSGKTFRGYKRWIISCEIFYAMVIFSIGFLDFKVDFHWVIVMMVIAFTASATQDIATDALAILILNKQERSLGNSMQSAGSFLGTVAGSGLLLIIFYHFGSFYLLLGLSLFVLIALVPLVVSSPGPDTSLPQKHRPAAIKDLTGFFQRKGTGKRILLLTTYYAGIIGTLTMMKPWLVDLGYNMQQIGWMSGVWGASSGAVMALVAGFVIRKTGRKKSLLLFASLGWVVALYFYRISLHTPSLTEIYAGIIMIWSVYAMSSVAVFTIAMDIVRPGLKGTDFTLQIVLTHLSSMIIAVFSGKFTQAFSYRGLFLAEAVIALLIIVSLPYLYQEDSLTTS